VFTLFTLKRVWQNKVRKFSKIIEVMTQIIQKGGRIGEHGKVVAEFENHEEAKQYAKDRRKHLTPGEKQYYKYSFIVKKVS
jgi:hypothetical protein